MRVLITCLVFVVFAVSANAQIDSKKKSGAIIPAIEAPKDSADSKKIAPEKIKPDDQLSGVKSPKVVGKLELPKKEFSMFPQEEFGNPGELYTKKLDKIEKTLLPEGHGENAGLKEDAFWGDYRTKSNYINIRYRDHGQIDGDKIHVIVDGDILSSVMLSSGFQGFRLPLKEGINKIEVVAVNEGSLLSNTAQYIVTDEQNNIISAKTWRLSKGVKVTLYIVKE